MVEFKTVILLLRYASELHLALIRLWSPYELELIFKSATPKSKQSNTQQNGLAWRRLMRHWVQMQPMACESVPEGAKWRKYIPIIIIIIIKIYNDLWLGWSILLFRFSHDSGFYLIISGLLWRLLRTASHQVLSAALSQHNLAESGQ